MLGELRVDLAVQTFLDCLVKEKPAEVRNNYTQMLDSIINASELVVLLRREKAELVASWGAKQAELTQQIRSLTSEKQQLQADKRKLAAQAQPVIQALMQERERFEADHARLVELEQQVEKVTRERDQLQADIAKEWQTQTFAKAKQRDLTRQIQTLQAERDGLDNYKKRMEDQLKQNPAGYRAWRVYHEANQKLRQDLREEQRRHADTKNDSLAARERYEQTAEKLQHLERAHANCRQMQSEYNALETKLKVMENELNAALANPTNGAGAPSTATDYVKENLVLTEKLREADHKHDKDQEALRKAYDESGLYRMHLGHFDADILQLQGLVDLYYGELEETKEKLADALSSLNKAKQEVEQLRASASNDFAAVPEEDVVSLWKQLDTGIRNLSQICFETGFPVPLLSDEQTAAFRAVSAAYPLYLGDGNAVGALCRAFIWQNLCGTVLRHGWVYGQDGDGVAALEVRLADTEEQVRTFGSVRTSAYGFLDECGQRDERRADELAAKIYDCLSPLASAERAPDLACGVEAIIGAAYELGAAISRARARYYPYPHDVKDSHDCLTFDPEWMETPTAPHWSCSTYTIDLVLSPALLRFRDRDGSNPLLIKADVC
ncbi:hypothetical protein DL769_009764 [Monosporascus sp. CRB-8-3]|nr:hypothetical protein DL769_009764 [Monosporascus sp. CRB-8-3]